jgi:hypothetical protein
MRTQAAPRSLVSVADQALCYLRLHCCLDSIDDQAALLNCCSYWSSVMWLGMNLLSKSLCP